MFSDVHRYFDLSDWHLRLFLSRTRVQLEVSGVAPSGNGIRDTGIASLTESPRVVAEVFRFQFALVSNALLRKLSILYTTTIANGMARRCRIKAR